LAAATVAAYWPVFRCDFVAFDDESYVTRNRKVQQGFTPQAVSWAFSSGRAANWHPLTWLSHILDCRLFGLNPRGHHAINLLFHTANTLLLFLLLTRMTGARWRSALVAGLFALHPLHVESVAWVAERKDVLSTFFGLLALRAYVRYVEKSQVQGLASKVPGSKFPVPGSRFPLSPSILHSLCSFAYASSLLFFACSLMSKPTLVTLPFLLLLLDYWPLQRFHLKPSFPLKTQHSKLKTFLPLLGEKLPFLALSLASCAITFVTQSKGGAVPGLEIIPVGARCAAAAVAYVRYLAKTFWPAHLSAFYQYHTWPAATGIGAGLLLLIVTALLLRAGSRRPYLPVGWFWFMGALVPMIGLVQAGDQAMADRYTYLPLVGLFIALAWSLGQWACGQPAPKGATNSSHPQPHAPTLQRFTAIPSPRRLVAVIAARSLLAACGALTFRQTGYWQNTQTLFFHALAVAPDNYRAHAVLGVALQDAGQPEQANAHFREALRLFPGNPAIHDDFARALLRQRRLEESAAEAAIALHLLPNFPEAHINLGCALADQGNKTEGIEHFRAALRLDPDSFDAHNYLGGVLFETGGLDEAVSHLQAALRLEPSRPQVHYDLGKTLSAQGRTREALPCFEAALRLDPDLPDARLALADALVLQERVPEALGQYRRLLRRTPPSPPVLNNLAWLLATHRNPEFRNAAEAVQLAERACAAAPKSWSYLDTLAAAYAEAGRFPEALAAIQKAITLAEAAGQPDPAAQYRTRLALYRQQRPFHEP